jgi:anti-sigma regulatory factor (Ser/Thr protein kinase)
VMATHAVPLGAQSPESGIVTITGRYRLPSDLLHQLKHALAENPLVVILDLHEAAGATQQLAEVLDPVSAYLAAWPATVLVVCVPDPEKTAPFLPPTIIDRIVLDRSLEAGLERARDLIPHQQRATTFLTPKPEESDIAREFTRRTLRDCGLEELIWPASLVVSELVTHSILQTHTVLDLSLSRVDRRIRIAVHDHGSDSLRISQLVELIDPLEDPLRHRGLLVVRALTRCWGVFPSREHGKTVWAVMEAPGDVR